MTDLAKSLHKISDRNPPIRLTIVQYGDYAEATARFQAGGEENYYAQRYTVDFVAGLAGTPGIERVTVISFSASARGADP